MEKLTLKEGLVKILTSLEALDYRLDKIKLANHSDLFMMSAEDKYYMIFFNNSPFPLSLYVELADFTDGYKIGYFDRANNFGLVWQDIYLSENEIKNFDTVFVNTLKDIYDHAFKYTKPLTYTNLKTIFTNILNTQKLLKDIKFIGLKNVSEFCDISDGYVFVTFNAILKRYDQEFSWLFSIKIDRDNKNMVLSYYDINSYQWIDKFVSNTWELSENDYHLMWENHTWFTETYHQIKTILTDIFNGQ